MATLELFFSFQLLFIFIFFLTTGRASACQTSSCSAAGPQVHFPFRLNPFQPSSCGYWGFDLSCNNQTQITTITLPGSGDFSVYFINYKAQALWIYDPTHCLPKRFIEGSFSLQTLNDTPFDVVHGTNYTFLNCSSSQALPQTAAMVFCLSNDNYTVFAVPSNEYDNWLQSTSPSPSPSQSTSMCSVISSAMVPSGYDWRDIFGPDFNGRIRLTWNRPYCIDCEARGGVCGLNTDTYQTACSEASDRKGKRHALPRSAKYGLIIGVGIPGLLCIIGLANYVWARIMAHGRPNQPTTDLSASTTHQPTTVIVGLDGPTIESYPKTFLGESRRLPNPNDNTCSICLSEYQPKEALRTIPECNHYFHASCIDEWLKMNATCPMCRTSPEGSSHVTSSASVSSSSSSSSLASTAGIWV